MVYHIILVGFEGGGYDTGVEPQILRTQHLDAIKICNKHKFYNYSLPYRLSTECCALHGCGCFVVLCCVFLTL